MAKELSFRVNGRDYQMRGNLFAAERIEELTGLSLSELAQNIQAGKIAIGYLVKIAYSGINHDPDKPEIVSINEIRKDSSPKEIMSQCEALISLLVECVGGELTDDEAEEGKAKN